MPKLTYNATGFPKSAPAGLSGTNTLTFTWSELVWAAITVGRAGMRDVTKYGLFSAFEIVYRAAMLYANLQEAANSSLTRSPAYNGLDPSEKGAVSYFLGLTLAKLFGWRLLQVPWLLHLDVYRTRLNVLTRPGKSKPDLVGQDSTGSWVVFESKGRTNDFEQSALDKAKKQTKMVRRISGATPKYRVALQSYFSSGVLQLSVDDPTTSERDTPFDLPLTREMLDHDYYEPFRESLSQDSETRRISYADRDYIVRPEPSFDFAFGLDEERNAAPAPKVAEEAAISDQYGQERFVGPDGVLVLLGKSWSSESMKKQPEKRRL
jgi:hypothetical protein